MVAGSVSHSGEGHDETGRGTCSGLVLDRGSLTLKTIEAVGQTA